MLVKITDNFIFLKVPYHNKEYVENILNGVYSKKEGMYRFPKNYRSMRELVKSFPDLSKELDFVKLGKKLAENRQKFAEMKQKDDISGDPRLRPYQRVDVHYLTQLPSAGIFNEPRTGKTPTSIQVIKELGTKKNLVICPASLVWNWGKEFEKWLPEVNVYVVHGAPKKREEIFSSYKADKSTKALIISKDTWKGVVDDWIFYTFDTVFVDEAHYLRNYKTQQAKAIFKVKAKHRYALTGTPTVKHAVDIWGILHFLYPEKFTSYWQFAERYFQVGEDWMGHKQIEQVKEYRKDELKELIGFVSVQRKRKEVMKWLPDKERITFYAKMDKKQEKLYKDMAENFMAIDEDTGHAVDTSNVLSQLTRLRQLCLDPMLLGFNVTSAKTQAIIEWVENNRENTVIMSMFTSYLGVLRGQIEALGLKVGMITGEMTGKEKQATAEKFQQGKLDVLLCNIISAGTGFTLDKAETIIFTDKAWNPSDNEQAEDRITPTTVDKNHKHTIISFVCKDSFDEHINRILDDKKSLTQVINEGGLQALKNLL